MLAATSSDRAVRRLGPSAWKWLHNATHVVFYLLLLHVGYFLFLHYTLSFHRRPPAPDWFRWPFLVAGLGVIALQISAFVRTSRRHRDVGRGSATTARRANAPASGSVGGTL